MTSNQISPKSIFAVLAAVLLVALWLVLPLRHAGPWIESFADRLRGSGLRGVMLFAATSAAAEIIMLPGAIMSLAAGFAFGAVTGFLIAWPASIVAATTAFLLGRSLLRDTVQRRLQRSPKLGALDQVVGANSLMLIVLLRLSPIVPFNALNYALGFSKVSFTRYVLATATGIVPGTWMYAYLGSLAPTAAGLQQVAERGGRARTAMTIVGLIATALSVTFVTRAARRALNAKLHRSPS